MSFHGYTFRFAPSADGRPQRLFLVDTRAVCPVCRNFELYRSFESTPFHSLTIARLRLMPAAARREYARPCAACGEGLTSNDVTQVVVTVGMSSGEGVIEARLERDVLTFVVVSWRSFDPQTLPHWPDELDDEHVLTTLDENLAHALLGRFVSAKQATRERMVAERHERISGRELVITRHVGPIVVEESPGTVVALLVDNGVVAEGYPAAPSEWLGDFAVGLAGTTIAAWVEVDAAVRGVLAVLGELPMPIRAFRDERDGVLAIAVPGAASLDECPRIDPRGIAIEAARTASEPGDIARLEVERMLWFRSGIWGEEFSDVDISRGDLVVEGEHYTELTVVSTEEDHHHDHG